MTVCTSHHRFFPCVSEVRRDCSWSDLEGDVWETCEYLLLTTPEQRIAELRSLP